MIVGCFMSEDALALQSRLSLMVEAAVSVVDSHFWGAIHAGTPNFARQSQALKSRWAL